MSKAIHSVIDDFGTDCEGLLSKHTEAPINVNEMLAIFGYLL